MGNETWSQVYGSLTAKHLCCLIGDPPQDGLTKISWIHKKLYDNDILIISLNLNTEVNLNNTREHSAQGWYETFFNLILGELQRSSLSVTSEQRREIRNQSRLMIDTLNPFLEFYKVLENIASAKERSFLLHLTEIHCLDDPKSNLSERDIRFFLEAIDSYCAEFLQSPSPSTSSDSFVPELYFILEGHTFPKSEQLVNLDILTQSIINLNDSGKRSEPSLETEITTSHPELSLLANLELDLKKQASDTLIKSVEQEQISVLETLVYEESELPKDAEVSSPKEILLNLLTLIDTKNLNISNTKSKISCEWLNKISLIALGFIGSILLIPVILSHQPQVQDWSNITPIPTSQLIESDLPQVTPSPKSPVQTSDSTSMLTPRFTPTKPFDTDLILQIMRQRTVYFYGATGENYFGQVFLSELRNSENNPDENGIAARIEWNDGVISAILFRDNFRVRVWEEGKEYSGRWYWKLDQSKLIVEMDDGARYEF